MAAYYGNYGTMMAASTVKVAEAGSTQLESSPSREYILVT